MKEQKASTGRLMQTFKSMEFTSYNDVQEVITRFLQRWVVYED